MSCASSVDKQNQILRTTDLEFYLSQCFTVFLTQKRYRYCLNASLDSTDPKEIENAMKLIQTIHTIIHLDLQMLRSKDLNSRFPQSEILRTNYKKNSELRILY
ncbi:MAG: hypothetical protein CM15mV65_500 [Caudoviricetes sp.]|nr:MAG: hypothetical protein CM15mV65_500 [Caudoviricetes sp.]